MKIKILDSDIKLNRREVRSCKRLVSNFISKVRDASKDNLSPTYYFTLLIVMHTMSQKLLADMEPDALAKVMNRLNDIDE